MSGFDNGPGDIVINAEALVTNSTMLAGFQVLMEASPYAVVVTDAEGKICMVNSLAETLFQYNRRGLVGKSIEILVPAPYKKSHEVYRREYLGLSHTRPMGAGLDLFALRRDGTEFAAEISLNPIRTNQGLWTVAAIQDVTEKRKKIEEARVETEKLERANKLLTNFMHVASHNLRSAARTVYTFTGILTEDFPDLDPKISEYFGYIQEAALALNRLLDNLVIHARTRGALEGLTIMSADAILSDVLASMRATLQFTKAELVVQAGFPAVTFYYLYLYQVLQNLIGNSLKFIGPNVVPRIEISAFNTGSQFWCFSVADNGAGIDPADQEKIFEPFFRVKDRAVQHEGSGLGLAICRRLVEEQGGRIWVESEPGQGTTFYFTLPEAIDFNADIGN